MGTFKHESVLSDEVLRYLRPERGGLFVDATVGGGGHGERILTRMERSGADGLYIGIDRDPDAIAASKQRLAPFGSKVQLMLGNFREWHHLVRRALQKWNKQEALSRGIDGVVFDLGVSSHQLDEVERGFTYWGDATLDMRMGPDAPMTAANLLATFDEKAITRILLDYGEERWAARIAQFIVEERQRHRIETADHLVDVIKRAVPVGARRGGPHPARRTFQALRMAVNDELGAIEEGVRQAIDGLAPGGRIAVISFHSLEDRLVKRLFADAAKKCTCPPELPVCRCDATPRIQIITRRPVTPSAAETEHNPRARSAKLRVAEGVLRAKEKE